MDWLQLGPEGTKVLEGVRFRQTDNFKERLLSLSGARAGVFHEGALHHAAAWGLPAVVIFGAMLSPRKYGLYDPS